jgi:3-hydroxyacyl-CoA dehydrogenase
MTPGSPLRVAVVGAGTLGTTAARAALAAGSPVTVLVRGGEQRCRSRAAELGVSLRRDAARGRLGGADADELLRRIRFTSRMTDLADADVVVESVPESEPLKREVIARIEDVVRADALVASTTSSIPASVLAAGAGRPERVVVAHYVWPAHRIRLVEVAQHGATDPAAAARLDAMLAAQGKWTVRVADRPGFLITRALFAYWDAAVELLRDGCAPAAVDDALTRFGWPMGPFAVMEATGLRSVARIYTHLAPHLGGAFPSLASLASAVSAGAVSIYGQQRSVHALLGVLLRRSTDAAGLAASAVVDRTVGALAAEVDRAVADGVVTSWHQAGTAIDLAYGFPERHGGLARWAHTARAGTSRASAAIKVPMQVGPTSAGDNAIERTPA